MSKIVKVGSTKLAGFSLETRRQKRKKEREKTKQEKEKFAEKLRQNPTDSEQFLRLRLIKEGWNFEFQPVMLGYIPDFYFPEHRKVIELDGKTFHNPVKDKRRDSHFEKHGIKTLRIKSHRVFHQLDWVIEEIEAFVFGISIKKRSKTAKKKANKTRRKTWRSFKINGSKPIDELSEQFRFATEGL